MTPRLNPYTASPEMIQAFLALSNAVAESGLEKPLLELVKIRSSQINGEAPCYTDRERAALGWTEALTLIADKGAPDDVYAALDAQFSKEEQVKLTMMINVINGWNRLAVAFHLFEPSLGWKA